jgi:hypothetical protein
MKNTSMFNDVLQIMKIDKDTVVFNDGAIAAVLQVKLRLPKKAERADQLKAMASFRLWLDTLHYPVQITSRTVNEGLKDRLMVFKANTEVFIKKKKDYKDNLSDFNRFYKWLEIHMLKNGKVERLCYIVIPHYPYYKNKSEIKKLKNFDNSASLLNSRAENAVSLLKNAKLDAIKMDNGQLKNLYRSFFEFSFYNKGKYETINDCIQTWRQEG